MDNENIEEDTGPSVFETTIKTNSKTLKLLIENQDPRISELKTNVACIDCPLNQWMAFTNEVKNFCRSNHVMSWPPTPEGVELCDGVYRVEK